MSEESVIAGVEVSSVSLALWERLCRDSECITPNVQPKRFLATTRALGAKPVIACLGDSDGCQGLIVGRSERIRVSRRIGYVPIWSPKLTTLTIVYGGVLGNIAPEQVVSYFVESFTGRARFDRILVSMMRTESPLLALMRERRLVVVQPPVRHWVQELNDSFESTMSCHSGKHRRRLRWERKKLEEQFSQSLEWRTLTSVEDIEVVLDDAATIGKKTYHDRVGGLVEANDVWRAQLRVAAENGGLRAHFLVADSGAIAFLLGWNECETLHIVAMAYLPEFSKFSPGKHLLLHAIERACADGMKRIDYGFGDADYKSIYGTESWYESTVTIYGNTARGVMAWVFDGGPTWIDKNLKRLAGSSFSSRLKRHWRQVLSR